MSLQLVFCLSLHQDYLACSSDLQEVLQQDPNVQEAEKELEEVTVLLRQSLAKASPAKARKTVPITEVDSPLRQNGFSFIIQHGFKSNRACALVIWRGGQQSFRKYALLLLPFLSVNCICVHLEVFMNNDEGRTKVA